MGRLGLPQFTSIQSLTHQVTPLIASVPVSAGKRAPCRSPGRSSFAEAESLMDQQALDFKLLLSSAEYLLVK